ncbi:uncharacterized protein YjiS (DUF1127 family) [Agrobacterium vitis]|nr:uncharacterized protein YjiS (DUF1127 family) [Agrobacterium vitis]MBE1436736.1 uncharacterized protein YjiS (DUF1127 family) [Agrobacterium vitis]
MRTTLQMTNRTFADVGMALTATLRYGAQQVKAVVRIVSNRRAAQKLVDMDDYLLKDLGLTRTELEHALSDGSYLTDPSLTLAHHAKARTRAQARSLSLG